MDRRYQFIQNLETHQDLSSIYYFCGHQQNDKDTHATILRTLTVQLLRSHLDMTELVHQVYLQKGFSRSFPAVKRILKEILFTIPDTRPRRYRRMQSPNAKGSTWEPLRTS